MSTIEVDKIKPQSGTNTQLGESGDTITVPSGATLDASNATTTLPSTVVTTTGTQTLTNKSIVATQLTGTINNARLSSIPNSVLANSAITINGSAVSLGGSTTIATGIDWQSSIVTAATLTAVANRGYWIDTSSNACTITLPGSASVGDELVFTDYARNWANNPITLNQNGLKFQGGTTNPVYSTNGESVNIVYSGATKGWIPNTDGAVADEGNFQAYSIDFLVIGGGGYGRGGSPGGGGAGGYRNSYSSETSGRGSSSESSLTLADATYTITVGAGGTANNGVDSSIAGSGITTVTSLGGGYGGSNTQSGNSGGAGGGAGENSTSGGSGTAGQGYDGGHSNGGGGGAGGNGYNGYGAGVGLPNGGKGGAGLASSITGSSVTRASGGSAYYAAPSPTRSANVTGGGGGASQVNGVANTGGGGAADGGQGGSGVVILRIPTSNYSGTTTGSPTVSTSGSDTILIFTGSGSYTA
jgi:hypothetical protein